MKSSALTARPAKNKKIEVRFNGDKLTSDAGAILLQKVDQKLQLSDVSVLFSFRNYLQQYLKIVY